jgi:hypothetical protein
MIFCVVWRTLIVYVVPGYAIVPSSHGVIISEGPSNAFCVIWCRLIVSVGLGNISCVVWHSVECIIRGFLAKKNFSKSEHNTKQFYTALGFRNNCLIQKRKRRGLAESWRWKGNALEGSWNFRILQLAWLKLRSNVRLTWGEINFVLKLK